MTRLRILALAALLAAIAACTTVNFTPGAPVPDDMRLILHVVTTDDRVLHFEVSREGKLAFAGGHDAIGGRVAPVCTLTPEQHRAIWDIVTQKHLLTAHSDGIFKKAKDVTYDLTVEMRGTSHSLHAYDDHVPGLAELKDLLFKDQAAVRYEKIPGLK